MPRRNRVSWSITAGSNARGNTIKGNIDTALSGKSLYQTVTANNRSGLIVSGEYKFATSTEGDTVYDAAVVEMNSTNATAGKVQKHQCDHDLSEQGDVGCLGYTTATR